MKVSSGPNPNLFGQTFIIDQPGNFIIEGELSATRNYYVVS